MVAIVTADDLDPSTLTVVDGKVVANDPTKTPNVLTGISGSDHSHVVDGDTVVAAIGKLQAQILVASAGDANFTWTQAIASDTWTITHPLGKYPSVTVIDSAGTEVEGDVSYPSTSQIVVLFSAAFGGFAYLN